MTERRFTDREIGLILKRAVEFEEGSPAPGLPSARGLSLRELQEVARETGIDARSVGRAVAEMESRRGLEPPSIWGPSGVRREVRLLEGQMSREVVGELMRVVDQGVDAPGTVVEALGGVRWTSDARVLSTQVSVEPSGEDTLLRVEEHFSDTIRGPLHGIWGSLGLVSGLAYGFITWNLALPLAIALTAITAMLGWAIGDLSWRLISTGNQRRVRRLMDNLTEEASRILSNPLGPPPGTPNSTQLTISQELSKEGPITECHNSQ
jgi:hypothetical protein